MISVIFPYWQRARATDANVASMARLYHGLDLELIVIDDGSPEAYIAPPCVDSRVRVIRLPAKAEPRNPCVPINRGVAHAAGEYIVLTSPEIIHRAPLLAQMLETAIEHGPSAYVQAAVWCPDENRWHSHSSRAGDGEAPMPPGACLHFLSLLHRSLWDAAGGFDEDYREGAAYEDCDFVWRVHRAGAKFVCRDDLVADHPHRNPRTQWLPGQHARNAGIFKRKWPC